MAFNEAPCKRERGTCLCVRASFRVRTVWQRLVDTETTGETEKERAGGDWLNGPPEGSFLFWCVAWWSRGCCGLSAVLRCGGAAPWSVWILRVWVVSGVCERQVQSTTRLCRHFSRVFWEIPPPQGPVYEFTRIDHGGQIDQSTGRQTGN